MPVPPQYNGEHWLWLNDISASIADTSSRLSMVRDGWGEFTPEQRSVFRDRIVNSLMGFADLLDEAIAEIRGISTEE